MMVRITAVLMISALLAAGPVEAQAPPAGEAPTGPSTETILIIVSREDIDLMARVVHGEAGNQDMTGRRLVVSCILNRVESESKDFPDTIREVIMQPSQFYTGATWASEEDYEAVYAELRERTDRNVLWFNGGGYLPYGTPLFQHGAHYFSGYLPDEIETD